MAMDPLTRRKIADHEERLQRIELELGISGKGAVEEKAEAAQPKASKKSGPSPFEHITFTQVITFLGVLGIVVGALSFFFYAVANQWIGEMAQVLIGIVAGFALFVAAYVLREKREGWSNIVFGGAYILEYIAIGVGVLSYHVVHPYAGVFLCLVLLASALALAFKFDSRMIAYYAVAGGYLLPFITDTFSSNSFTLLWYVLLSLALVVIAFWKRWADLRFVSFGVTMIFILSYLSYAMDPNSRGSAILFLVAVFGLYHVAGIMNSLRDASAAISTLDAITLVLSPVFLFSYLYPLLDWSLTAYGLLVLVYALAQIGEIYYLKQNGLSRSATITLLATGFVSLNLGLLFFIHETQWTYWIVLFAAQQALFAYMATTKSSEAMLHRVFSYIFLGLTMIWLLVIVFSPLYIENLGEATAYLAIALALTASFIAQTRKGIDFFINAGAFIITGFLTLMFVARYAGLFLGSTNEANQAMHILMSVLWLIYTVLLLKQVSTVAGKTLVGILLGIALCKIAFHDLLFLHGAYRIVGFILFGVLLLIGGYLIRK